MAKILLKHLISFSSQDPVYCAENLITKNSTNKPFLCSKEDRSGILEAEFELDRASYISYIDIGNYGSNTIEIMVGRSSGPRNANYVCLLPATTFMSLSDKKIGRNLTTVRMFKSDNFTTTASKEKWDRVKVICGQPYRKDVQFGISFLHLGSKESITPQNGLADVLNSDISKNSSPSRLNSLKRPFPSNAFQSRGRQLLNSSLVNTAKKKRKPVPYSFQIAALTFLTADFEDDLFEESRSFEDYIREFEKQREQSLTDDEKCAFHTIYSDFVSGSSATLADLTSQENYISASPSNNYAASQKRLTNGTHSRVDISDTENSAEVKGLDFRSEKTLQKHNGIRNSFGRSFDFTSINNTPFRSNGERDTESQKRFRKTPNGRKSTDFECSSQQSNTPKFDLDIQIKPKPVNGHGLTNGNKPKDPAETPTQFKVGFLRPEDFIQFDGSEPTTSKGVVYVDCPICGEPFHTAEIEAHAAYCGTPESEQLNNGALMLKRNGTSTHHESKKRKNTLPCLLETSDPNRVYSTMFDCPCCGNYFDQDEIEGHTNICLENSNV